jgi:hypothetical protein
MQAAVLKSQPMLVLVVDPDVDVAGSFEVHSGTRGEDVIAQLGIAEWVLEASAAIKALAVGRKSAEVPEVAAADFGRALLASISGGAEDLMILGLKSPVRSGIHVEVDHESGEVLALVIRPCGRKAAADLNIGGPGSGGNRLAKYSRGDCEENGRQQGRPRSDWISKKFAGVRILNGVQVGFPCLLGCKSTASRQFSGNGRQLQ